MIELRGESQGVLINTELEQFQVKEQESDIGLDICWTEELMARQSAPVFDSGATWRLFTEHGELVLEFTSPATGTLPYKQMRVDQSFSRAELALSRAALKNWPAMSALEYPVSELLVTNYLAYRGEGVEVHGCGIVDGENRGHILLGHSGAGKSTTARLWEKRGNVEILSDDRLILRQHGSELWMYGTPWHGEAAFASPSRAKLESIFILQHGIENRFVALPQGRAIAETFARCFVPFYSKTAVHGIVDFLSQILTFVPCYEFHFVPDVSAVEAVLEFAESR